MRTIKTKVYKFTELEPQIQEQILNKFCSDGVFYEEDSLSDIIGDIIQEIEDKTALKVEDKIYYDLDGRESYIYINASIVLSALKEKYNLIDLDIPTKLGCYRNYLGGGLHGELTNSEIKDDCAIFEDDYDELKSEVEQKLIIQDLKIIQDILKEGFKELWRTDYEMNSEEYIKDGIIANEYEFYSDGRMI